jgi:hypothetical protein
VRTRVLMLGLAAVLLMAMSVSSAACSSSGPTTTSSTSPTPGVGDAPSKAEIKAAINGLTKPPLRGHDLAAYGTVTVFKLEHDASGRWLASAHLTPPVQASWPPSNIVVVKNPHGWRIISLRTDWTFGGTQPSPPISQVRLGVGLDPIPVAPRE